MQDGIWLTVAEVADWLNVSRGHVYRLIATGGLPAVKVISDRRPYRSWSLPAAGIHEWIDDRSTVARTVPPRSGPPEFAVVTHALDQVDAYGPLAEQLAAALAGV